MSLDVYLNKTAYLSYDKGTTYTEQKETVYSANITHNLGDMASKAGIYEALWRPYRLNHNYTETEDYNKEMKFEDGIETKAKEIINIVEKGLTDLKERPEYFKQFNSPNGWGMYEHFVPFVEEYLKALKENPEASIEVSR